MRRPKDVPDEEFEEYRRENEVPFTTVTVKVVGLRYYDGIVHKGEWAKLVREPHNPYDKNAVRVTTMEGAKVGHINQYAAKTLRSTLDDESREHIRVECDFPFKGTESCYYDIMARLRFWGFPTQQKIAEAHSLSTA